MSRNRVTVTIIHFVVVMGEMTRVDEYNPLKPRGNDLQTRGSQLVAWPVERRAGWQQDRKLGPWPASITHYHALAQAFKSSAFFSFDYNTRRDAA